MFLDIKWILLFFILFVSFPVKAAERLWYSSWDRSGSDKYPPLPQELLQDPSRRMDASTQVPLLIRPRVHFWLEIYGRFPSWARVLHDKEHPHLIYGYIDCGPFMKPGHSPMRQELNCMRVEKRITAHIKRMLLEIDKHPTLKSYIQSKGVQESEYSLLYRRLRTQKGQRDLFLLAIQRSKNYMPNIEGRFSMEMLPKDLSRIPFVESSFHPQAQSKVKAIGIWQFMPKTAKEFIHPHDRTLWADPLMQTRGAARMLKRNQSVLRDWGLTVTSYNSGIGRVMKLSKKYQLNGIEGLLTLPKTSRSLGFAGKNFFAEYLAANLVYRYQDEVFLSAELNGPFGALLPTSFEKCVNFNF